MNIKKVLLEKYKLVNLSLLLTFLLVILYMNSNYTNWFTKDADIIYIYKYYDGLYSPIFKTLTWLSGILATLLLFPSRIFKAWLIYILPVFLVITFLIVRGISVYSTNLLNPTRGQMAENCMISLSVVTFIFALWSLVRGRKNKMESQGVKNI